MAFEVRTTDANVAAKGPSCWYCLDQYQTIPRGGAALREAFFSTTTREKAAVACERCFRFKWPHPSDASTRCRVNGRGARRHARYTIRKTLTSFSMTTSIHSSDIFQPRSKSEAFSVSFAEFSLSRCSALTAMLRAPLLTSTTKPRRQYLMSH